MTISEEYFERFCECRRISCEKLQVGKVKTPDYKINVNGINITVEIKQLEPNDEEKEVILKRTQGNVTVYKKNIFRPHKNITKGVDQLRSYSKHVRKQPAIVVLYEVADFGHLDPYVIDVCLYGIESVHIMIPPPDIQAEPRVLGLVRGGNRIATEEHNTTLSAVGVLRIVGKNETLTLYHNKFAAYPIQPDDFRFDGVRHFARRKPDENDLRNWAEIT